MLFSGFTYLQFQHKGDGRSFTRIIMKEEDKYDFAATKCTNQY